MHFIFLWCMDDHVQFFGPNDTHPPVSLGTNTHQFSACPSLPTRTHSMHYAYASSVKECLSISLIKLHVKFFVTLLCLVLEVVPNRRGRWLSMNQLSSHEYLRMHFISIYRYWTLEDAYWQHWAMECGLLWSYFQKLCRHSFLPIFATTTSRGG
jgi:hypothetical protein